MGEVTQNLFIAIFGGAALWVLRLMWNATVSTQRDLKDFAWHSAKDHDITRAKITELATHVPERYVTKVDFHRTMGDTNMMLRRINDKIDKLTITQAARK
jgi:hypothetical protein